MAVVDTVPLEVTQAVFETVAVRVVIADGLTREPDGLNVRRTEGDTVLLIEKLPDGLTLGVKVGDIVDDIDCPALALTEIELDVDGDKVEFALKEDDEESVIVSEGDREKAGDEEIEGLREYRSCVALTLPVDFGDRDKVTDTVGDAEKLGDTDGECEYEGDEEVELVTIDERVFTEEELTELVAVINNTVLVTLIVALTVPRIDNDIEALPEFDGVPKDEGESEIVPIGEKEEKDESEACTL